ncbi:D-malate degradation protein R [Hartmannibacter diazotrophicus]|uniref:D-malate degradation protein R n=1 Tax=Hartmannibacter diazotrophicus TaxID=1482074 RepID=A0A2C9D386_9HYPH|nr:LysR family transcriptional regulator [Hartmannibacter diazotrophicus]SON53935.1 D-malate degradation protein R [Hartmannibacter diazotrophicus]
MLLDNLALFVKIVETGSLSAAAREAGLSPATVSERLVGLEAHYGAALLTRTTRAISLTDEGRLVLDGARRLLAEADELEGRIRLGTRSVSGPIRLSSPQDLGRSRIWPIVDRFLAENPDVSVELDLNDSIVDLVGSGLDFAIRYGALADSSLRARHLGENRRIVCAAPEYLERMGVPEHPGDLARHDCISLRYGGNIERTWPFRIDGRLQRVMVRGRRVANDGWLVRHWCLAGHGLCLKSNWDVEADLAAGRLVEVLGEYSAGRTALQIVYPPAKVQPRRVRALIDMIAAELSPPQAI